MTVQWPVTLESSSKLKISLSSNWDTDSLTPSLISSSPTLTYSGVTTIVSSSYAKQITLVLNSQVNASGTITFRLSIMNPTSNTIGSSDILVEVYNTSDALTAKGFPLSSTITMTCNSGCSACTDVYTFCTSCDSGYELISNRCIILSTSSSCTFGNNYMGMASSTMMCQYVWAQEITSSSEITLYFSSNWD